MKALTGVGKDNDVARGRPHSRVQRGCLAARLVTSNESHGTASRPVHPDRLPGASPVEGDDHFDRRGNVGRFEAVLDAGAYRRRVVTGRDHNGDRARRRLQAHAGTSNPPSREASQGPHHERVQHPHRHQRDGGHVGPKIQRSHHVTRPAQSLWAEPNESPAPVVEPSAIHAHVRRNPSSSDTPGRYPSTRSARSRLASESRTSPGRGGWHTWRSSRPVTLPIMAISRSSVVLAPAPTLTTVPLAVAPAAVAARMFASTTLST